MIKVYVLIALLFTAFATGGSLTRAYYTKQIQKQADIFKEDQAKKKKSGEDFGNIETKEADKQDTELETKSKELEKGPKPNDTSDRIVVPSVWMRELSKLR